MLDLVIRNGLVVDGSGSTPFPADIGIEGDRIAAVGALSDASAARVIDATGRIVTPGFIDTHSHTDFTVLGNPTQESTVRQGVTTEVVGNCGIGCYPLSELSRSAAVDRLRGLAYDGPVEWRSFGDFWTTVARAGTSANFASFVPHNAVRAAAGVRGPEFEADQLRRMVADVEEAMEAGAIGLSTGLEFEPGRLATADELRVLAQTVGRHHGIYVSHMRNRDVAIAAALDEFLDLTRAAGGRGQCSHLNVRHNTGAPEGAWSRAVERLERERAAGMDVFADATPMRTGDGTMAAILPPWLMADGPAVAAERLRDVDVRRRARDDGDRYWRFIAAGEWHRVRLLGSPEYPDLCGLTFPEIAKQLGCDEWDAFFDILVAAGENIEGPGMIGELFTEEMSVGHVSHPLFLLGADTMSARVDGPLSLQTRHPLHFAAHTHILVHHVREVGALSLEEAVRKMTSMVADRFGLRDRGRLRTGAFADVAVIDFEGLAEVSTIERPLAYARGVEHVLVNGVAVVDDADHTGARPGRFLAPSGA